MVADGVDGSALADWKRTLNIRDTGKPVRDASRVHQRVRSVWIAADTVLTLQTLNAIRHFEYHNLFMRRCTLLQPELSRACRLGPRAAAFLHRPALLEHQSGHEWS